MKIFDLQKMTLLDYPGKVACTVFLGGCNMRCPYCHNAPLLDTSAPALFEKGELLDFLRKRRGLLDGVCLTGGEPLLQAELGALLHAVKELGFCVKLDTNGARPADLKRLVGEGAVDYVAMDVKNCPARYAQTAGIAEIDLNAIRESVAFLLSGTVEYEFRTTVVKEFHDAAAFEEIGPWLAGAERYFLQSFEDRDTVLCPGLHPRSAEELASFAEILRPYIPAVQLRGI